MGTGPTYSYNGKDTKQKPNIFGRKIKFIYSEKATKFSKHHSLIFDRLDFPSNFEL